MKTPEDRKPEHEEEVAHYDDAVIGKAFRYSLGALVCLLVGGGAFYYVATREKVKAVSKTTEIKAPVVQQFTGVTIPEAKFKDVTAESGITFVHNNGARGDKLLPETMGAGVAFLDYDNDGDQDLLFINGNYWPNEVPPGKKPTTPVLYQNDGKGKFLDVTVGSGLEVPMYGVGVAVGDYNNDGATDIFISCVGENHLFKNTGKGFINVTPEAGVAGSPKEYSTSSTFLDYDNDGDLDLFVCNYVRWSREIDFEVGYKLVGVGRAYGQPMNFEGTFPYLYRNEGNGKFTDVSEAAGVQIANPSTKVPVAKSLGVVPVDVDSDGWIDLVVANDTVQNFLFKNQKNGTFKEMGSTFGIAFDAYGATRGAMGIDVARYREDGALGIVIGNFANEMTALYVSEGQTNVFFTDEAITEGIGPASRLLLKFGVFFFDYDLDGRLDILSSNGHLEEEINQVQKSQQYKQPAQLFWNTGPARSGSFAPVTAAQAGSDLFKPIVGRGSAFADIDGDGDLDVVFTQTGGAPMLLRNEQALNHSFVRVKAVGTKNNKDAIGAWIHLQAGGKDIWRQVTPSRSYLSQSELPVTIGLGKEAKIEMAEIIWPGGDRQSIEVQTGRVTVVEEKNSAAGVASR